MSRNQKLTKARIEQLAIEIRTFLLNERMWIDVNIYFNGKCFSTYDKKTGKRHYNNPEYLIVNEGESPNDCFKYVNPDHILSMSYEGDACCMIYYCLYPRVLQKFNAIFMKYGLYYEIGDHWNMSCYYS